MHDRIISAIVLAQLVNLGMTIVATRNAIVSPGGLDLIIFELAVGQTLFLEARLQKAAPAPAAVVVGLVGGHIHKIFLPHHGLDHKPQIIGDGVAVAFTDNLTGILNRKFDLEILVPVGINFQFSLPDPFCVVFINILNFEIMFDVEFFQSCQD